MGELEFLNPHPRCPRFKSFGKKRNKSLSSVPRFNKPGELGAEKIQEVQEVLTRFWHFGYKRPFTLKFHPHHNRS